jgi:hypothetical protein
MLNTSISTVVEPQKSQGHQFFNFACEQPTIKPQPETVNPARREIAQPSYSFYKMWYSTRHAATIWVNIPI